jgi:hypothetical protein
MRRMFILICVNGGLRFSLCFFALLKGLFSLCFFALLIGFVFALLFA